MNKGLFYGLAIFAMVLDLGFNIDYPALYWLLGALSVAILYYKKEE